MGNSSKIEVVVSSWHIAWWVASQPDISRTDKVEVFIHLQPVLMLLKSLVALAQDEVVVNLPDKRLVLVNPQLRKEGFSDLGERLPP